MSKPTPPKYKTTNWPAYNHALRSRGSLTIWLDRDMCWRAPLTGKAGRNPTFSDAAIQFCLTIKGLFGLPLRQTTGFVESLFRLAYLDWPVPDFSTLSRRQKTLDVTIPYQPRSGALHLLIDSTGIKFRGEGEWKCKKHGAEYRRQWRKVHLGIDAETLEIRAIEVTDNSVGDAPMLPQLLSQIPESEPVATVSGDGAYDTRACHEAIAAREAAAVIPIRKNGKPWKGKTAGDRALNEILEATRYLGMPLWKKWTGYHRRSLVETKMRCFKLLGERVMARDPHRQVVELQVRAAILNSYTQLGGAAHPSCVLSYLGKGEIQLLIGLCNKARSNHHHCHIRPVLVMVVTMVMVTAHFYGRLMHTCPGKTGPSWPKSHAGGESAALRYRPTRKQGLQGLRFALSGMGLRVKFRASASMCRIGQKYGRCEPRCVPGSQVCTYSWPKRAER